MFDPTKPVQTRDGRKARIVDTSYSGDYILAVVSRGDSDEYASTYFKGGNAFTQGVSDHDLINVPPEHAIKFANVYSDGSVAGHATLERASSFADVGYAGTLKITVTGNKITAEQVA